MTEVIETGAGSNLIRRSSIASTWKDRMNARKDPGFTAATNQYVNVDGVLLLHARFRYLRVKAWLGCRNSYGSPETVRDVLFRMLRLGIYPQEREVVPLPSHRVAIVDKLEKSKDPTDIKYRTTTWSKKSRRDGTP